MFDPWKNLLARLKRRLSFDDLFRTGVMFAKAGLNVEPVATAFKRMSEIDPDRDWFIDWQQQLASCLKPIADAPSREEQALLCRMEILENIEKTVLNIFLVGTNDTNVRDYWVALKYSEDLETDPSQYSSLLIVHCGYSLLTAVALQTLYEEQFERYLPLEEFTTPYRVICSVYTEVLGKTLLVGALMENNEEEMRSVGSRYAEHISDPLLLKIRESKESFATAISKGRVHDLDEFREGFLQILDEYSEALEEIRSTSSK